MASIRFQCLRGCPEGETYEFYNRVVLGRDATCDLTLPDLSCSRRHAVIETLVDRHQISDLGSRNGLKVNGERVTEAPLHYGDRFQIGRSLFVFLSEIFDGAEEPTAFPYSVRTLDVQAVDKRLTDDLDDEAEALSLEGTLDSGDAPQARRSRKESAFLYGLTRELSDLLDTDAIIRTVTHRVFGTIENAERVSCFLFESSEPPALKEVSLHSRVEGDNAPVSRTILTHVQRERLGILCEDALGFSRSQSICASRLRSFMCIPLIARKALLGFLYVDSLSRPRAFSKDDFEFLTLTANIFASTLASALAYSDAERAHLETVRSLGKALEAKDHYTRGHSARVAMCAVGIGKHLGLSFERIRRLRLAAELHDIGKIAVKDALLGKEAGLSPEELEETKKHPAAGVEILRPVRLLQPILPFILHHHERYDGTGYPDGLKGEEIPLEARIIHLADAFDAMTTQRPYNNPVSVDDAIACCQKEAGESFDPDCVRALLCHLSEDEHTSSALASAASAVDRSLQTVLRDFDRERQEAQK